MIYLYKTHLEGFNQILIGLMIVSYQPFHDFA